MVKRWRLLLAVGLLAYLGLGALVAVPCLPPPKPGVTVESFRRLDLGLTEEQVEDVLGTPAQSSTRICPDLDEPDGRLPPAQDITVKFWRGERCSVTVSFSGRAFEGELQTDDGRVVFLSSRRPEPTFWDRLRRLLRW
jgi:hypothetical protein